MRTAKGEMSIVDLDTVWILFGFDSALASVYRSSRLTNIVETSGGQNLRSGELTPKELTPNHLEVDAKGRGDRAIAPLSDIHGQRLVPSIKQ